MYVQLSCDLTPLPSLGFTIFTMRLPIASTFECCYGRRSFFFSIYISFPLSAILLVRKWSCIKAQPSPAHCGVPLQSGLGKSFSRSTGFEFSIFEGNFFKFRKTHSVSSYLKRQVVEPNVPRLFLKPG